MSEPANPQRSALLSFISKKKFTPERNYPGATNEQNRLRFESIINDLAKRLLLQTDMNLSKEKLLNEFKATLPEFEYADTEERERSMAYLEEIMVIFAIKDSDGLLDKSLYGFDPKQSPDIRNQEAVVAMSEAERKIAKIIDSLTAENAFPILIQTFGKPTVQTPAITMWMDEKTPTQAISLSTHSGKSAVVWLVKGRFTYSKNL